MAPGQASASALRSIPRRASLLVRTTLLLDAVLAVAGPTAIASQVDPVAAYVGGGVAFTPTIDFGLAATIFVVLSAVAVAAYMDRAKGSSGEERRLSSWGNWWLLLLVPAILGNYFDFFVGHLVFMVFFVAMAYLSYAGRERSWKWGAALGTFIAVFYATDGSGDLIRGGPWNVSGVTLSSTAVTQTAWGLLAFTSDMIVAMALIPLVYSMYLGSRRNLTILLVVAMFLVTVPRLALLPVLGFQAVFGGWPSLVANAGNLVALVAVPLVWKAKKEVT
ncbi:MAG: hypothetical protein JRM83_04140 [Nitrososphaerota archaeon]|nr:hypothetical protein [Nitrososphaerota archaeon]